MSTRFPPEGEDPVRVGAEIRWRNASASVAIPEVFAYSAGLSLRVEYRLTEGPPPSRGDTPQERRRVADEATERVRTRLQLASRITVNGAPVSVIRAASRERGFTVWVWCAYPPRPVGQPAGAALIQLNSPQFPGADATVAVPPPGSPTAAVDYGVTRTYIPPQGEDPVVVRPEILWQNRAAAVAIPEVYFYSTGVYLPVTYRTLPARPPARRAQTEEEEQRETAQSDSRMRALRPLVEQVTVNGIRVEPRHYQSRDRWFTFTAWIWIAADGPQDALRVQLNVPEFPGADAIIACPPPGTPAAPAPGVPQSWDERGENWGRSVAVLRSSDADPAR